MTDDPPPPPRPDPGIVINLRISTGVYDAIRRHAPVAGFIERLVAEQLGGPLEDVFPKNTPGARDARRVFDQIKKDLPWHSPEARRARAEVARRDALEDAAIAKKQDLAPRRPFLGSKPKHPNRFPRAKRCPSCQVFESDWKPAYVRHTTTCRGQPR